MFSEHDDHRLLTERRQRLAATMVDRGIPALLTADPVDIAYACGARNMTVYGMMGPSRFALVFAEGPTILYEFAGCEHLSVGLPTVDEVRPAPAITANAGDRYEDNAATFAAELAAECTARLGIAPTLAVERVDFPLTDALRRNGVELLDAHPVVLAARRIKQPAELDVIRSAVGMVEQAVGELAASIRDGAPEVEMWAEFHRGLIAREGEYVTTRLFQGGPNTFPYFREAGPRPIRAGELLCLDTDAIATRGYAVDFSRTFRCGDDRGTTRQRDLFALALEQLRHNADLLAPGRSYEDFARNAWPVPAIQRPFGYYCLAHGIGLSGEFPNVPPANPGEPYALRGELESGMTVCVESYVGDPDSAQGVKLEDQYLITGRGAERLTTFPFEPALAG
ncbi:MAG: aminopeptidase P family protein [Acidimicrobiia bacterium]|nr:aminopeptidase P family protein [Acidimicrobiia bacterium]MDQ3391473.1 Xaa-Pro peptidase family protein [Actinomycetota bacterium]